jgi:hypothetical protein
VSGEKKSFRLQKKEKKEGRKANSTIESNYHAFLRCDISVLCISSAEE